MRWGGQRESDNIEDRRGMGGLAVGGGGIGLLIIALLVWLCGGDPRQFLQNLPDQTTVQQPANPAHKQTSQDDQEKFARLVLGSTEDVWGQVLPQQARIRYTAPTLVLFSGQTTSSCGGASAAMGPFYCPGDRKLYLDFAFFQELEKEFKAPGDFAQAYVIAHEVGHHVQNLLGTMNKFERAGPNNRASVALELQADCYAGIWGYYAKQKGIVEAEDPEEAIRAAAAVGDDTIQRRTQGYVVPDSFTHGSANDRIQWFTRGFQSGQLGQCQTTK
jgi:predicted metalloprotease